MTIKYWREFRLLFMIQILEMRNLWVVTLIFSSVIPFIMVFGLGSIGSGQNTEGLIYIVSGSTVVMLVTLGVVGLSQEMATMKLQGIFLYYASLPISKESLLVAVLMARLITQIPGVIIILVGGSLIYHLPLQTNPLIIPILLLSLLSLSGIGGAMGLALPPQIVPILASVTLFGILFGAPVLIPLAHFPVFLRWIGLLLPPTYAADALRGTFTNSNVFPLPVDIGVLVASTIASFWLIARGVKWKLQ
jgi:ABC-2 type transport system permease protein